MTIHASAKERPPRDFTCAASPPPCEIRLHDLDRPSAQRRHDLLDLRSREPAQERVLDLHHGHEREGDRIVALHDPLHLIGARLIEQEPHQG